jgi:hypothetical protein
LSTVEWFDDLPKKESDLEEEKKLTEWLRDRIIQLASGKCVCPGLANLTNHLVIKIIVDCSLFRTV